MDKLSHEIVEFYEKLSSWEHSVVKNAGYSLPQVHAVEILGANGAMRMKELAEKIGITTGTLTVQIDKMEKAGLVTRKAHVSDRRAILVDLTDKGVAVYKEHDQLHHTLTTQITAKFSDDERQQLLTFFERINQEF
ncbi:MarR family winged helix-turn-helix transcriptional regulator [Shewanella psychrotolerans]|uniref:MarR family winged helix-turn-helix transcriptional regulator n=1 Tax=Shewanella psychrotolerans TaxID=2864206 RepID=UPI001C65987A|nr:MarR family transcriptional regulator [Shewanella psychrotolerans]QYJ99893.1 MarR family transcriptional regulator [Shewanella psychrotolerans]